MFLHGDAWFVGVRQFRFGLLGSVGARCVEARWGMAVKVGLGAARFGEDCAVRSGMAVMASYCTAS